MADATYEGFEGAIRIATTSGNLASESDLAHFDSIDLKYANAIDNIMRIGQRLPEEIKESNITIDLDLSVFFTDTNVVTQGVTKKLNELVVDTAGALTEYFVGIYPEGYVSTNVSIVLEGKFGAWNLTIGTGNSTMEKVTFKAKTITISTVA